MKKNKFSIVAMLVMGMFIIGACGANGTTDSSKSDGYDTAMQEGKKEISKQNYSEAEKAFNEALDAKAKDTAATTYLQQTQSYIAADDAYQKGELTEAKTQVEKVTAEAKGSKDLVTAGKKLATKIDTLATQQTDYQKLYDDSQAQYTAGKLNEAAGTIDLLLAKDLSNAVFSDLKAKATTLKDEINQAQAEKAKEEEAIVPDSKYKKERNSELIGKDFAAATGLDIKTASDDQIATWLAQRESDSAASQSSADSSANQSSSASSDSSAAASSSTADTSSSADSSVVTPTYTDADIVQAVEKITGISSADNEYYVTKENDDVYQVEIRHSHTVGDTEISNMVGMFEYTISTKALTKLDPITGNYNPFQKIN